MPDGEGPTPIKPQVSASDGRLTRVEALGSSATSPGPERPPGPEPSGRACPPSSAPSAPARPRSTRPRPRPRSASTPNGRLLSFTAAPEVPPERRPGVTGAVVAAVVAVHRRPGRRRLLRDAVLAASSGRRLPVVLGRVGGQPGRDVAHHPDHHAHPAQAEATGGLGCHGHRHRLEQPGQSGLRPPRPEAQPHRQPGPQRHRLPVVRRGLHRGCGHDDPGVVRTRPPEHAARRRGGRTGQRCGGGHVVVRAPA